MSKRLSLAVAVGCAWLVTALTFRFDRFGPVAWPYRLIDALVWQKDWVLATQPRLYFVILAEYWGGNILTWSAVLYQLLRWASRHDRLRERSAGDA